MPLSCGCLCGWCLSPFHTLIVICNTTCFINMATGSIAGTCYSAICSIDSPRPFLISSESLLIRSFCKVSCVSPEWRGLDVQYVPACTELFVRACICKSSWKCVGVRWYPARLSGVCNTAVSSRSNGESRKRTLSGCSSDSVSGGLPPTPRRVSWRQKIFLRVASPMNKPSASMQHPGLVTQSLKQSRQGKAWCPVNTIWIIHKCIENEYKAGGTFDCCGK